MSEPQTTSLVFEFAPHAALMTRYDLHDHKHIEVGHHMGEYARETSDGAEYRCLGVDKYDAKKQQHIITHMSDLECSAFYPSTLFLTGEDHEGESLPHALLEVIAKRVWNMEPNRIKPVILPRGWDNRWTWWKGIQFVRASEWWFMQRYKLSAIFPATLCDIISSRESPTGTNAYTEIFIEDMRQFMGQGHITQGNPTPNLTWLEYAPQSGETIRSKKTGEILGVVSHLDGNLALDFLGEILIIWRFQDGLNNLHVWESKRGGPEVLTHGMRC